MRVVSLFSGAGGMDVGVKNAGFKIIGASEIDSNACETYRKNHPETELIEGDINLNIDRITSFKDIDLVVGGPPCQGFSVAGKMDLSDPRSQLVFAFCQVVEKLKPKAFIMENVKALGVLMKFEKVREEIIRRMEGNGYQVTLNVLNAKDFGVPQSRERVFFTGVKQNHNPVLIHHYNEYKKETVSLRQAIQHLGRAGSKNNANKTKAIISLAKNPILRKSPYAGMMFNGQGRPLNPDGWSSTLPASMGGNRTPIIDEDHLYDGKESWIEEHHKKILSGQLINNSVDVPSRLRRLTVNEASILQTFPSNYKFTGTPSSVFRQIGNAVPCKLAEVVALAVKKAIS
ncbi:DNA cytosine methyltransferase [Francisellaceae bacterium]|nr:DNA cytosine methyltransferase [Francisellaceae bacterium]